MGAPAEDLRSKILLKTLRLYLVFLHCVFAPSDTVPQLPCLFISFQKIRKIKYILRTVVRISSPTQKIFLLHGEIELSSLKLQKLKKGYARLKITKLSKTKGEK